jgi:predicted ferric reductase
VAGGLDAVGRLSGMVGTYLMLVMLVLIARIPWLERTVGQDRLIKWHRKISAWPIFLILVHVGTITWGYARASKIGLWSQYLAFLQHYSDMVEASIALVLLLVLAVTSYPTIRRKLRYEVWWTIHLSAYVAMALAFLHQVHTGIVFIGHPLAIAVWTGVFALVALSVIGGRVAHPLWFNLKHQLRVHSVEEVARGVYSVVIKGKNVQDLAVSGGQFFQWRFLAPGLLLHSHPYSLSALPNAPYLRVSVKSLGDQSSAVAQLTPGTRVFVDGPYGVFTRHKQMANRALLIGAGVGVTPLRALLEDLPQNVKVTVILRGSSEADLVHREEMKNLVTARRGTYHEVVGSRSEVELDAVLLRKLVATVASSDIYICGPQGFTASVVQAALANGASRDRIHQEEFSFA